MVCLSLLSVHFTRREKPAEAEATPSKHSYRIRCAHCLCSFGTVSGSTALPFCFVRLITVLYNSTGDLIVARQQKLLHGLNLRGSFGSVEHCRKISRGMMNPQGRFMMGPTLLCFHTFCVFSSGKRKSSWLSLSYIEFSCLCPTLPRPLLYSTKSFHPVYAGKGCEAWCGLPGGGAPFPPTPGKPPEYPDCR